MDDKAYYAARLERVIQIAAEALRSGDVEYAERVLSLAETWIRASMAAMESEHATKH